MSEAAKKKGNAQTARETHSGEKKITLLAKTSHPFTQKRKSSDSEEE